MNPIRRRPCADPGQKQVPGEWMTQKGIDSSRPVTEASRAKLNKAHERSHHRFTGVDPAFPAQWFYGLLRALPGDQACLTPSPALLSADLTPASGRQNDTTWPYASASFVWLAFAHLTLPRPPHPLPNVRDDRETPPLWVGTMRDIEVIWVRRQAKFLKFGNYLLDRILVICPSG